MPVLRPMTPPEYAAWLAATIPAFGHNAGAQALYSKLDYQPTNISLFKPIGLRRAAPVADDRLRGPVPHSGPSLNRRSSLIVCSAQTSAAAPPGQAAPPNEFLGFPAKRWFQIGLDGRCRSATPLCTPPC
jgi:hypothetical protein